MKNACIALLKEGIDVPDQQTFDVLQAFVESGYFFEEIRILALNEHKKIKECLFDLKKEADNLLLLADKSNISLLKNFVLEIYDQSSILANFGEANIYDDKKTCLFLLPSNDFEQGISYAKKACIPYLDKKFGQRKEKIVIRSMGASEAHIQRLIMEAKQNSGEKMAYRHRRKYDEDVIEIFYGNDAPKMLIDDILRFFAERLGDTMYALEDVSLEEQLVNLLKVRGKKISLAESFTGGGIARRIVSVPGASDVYFEGLNTYHELSKMQRLGVNEFTLRSFGAVSEKTAYEMALGVLQNGNADISIATTGLAGPKSDRSMLPVGLCFIAVGTKERIFVYRYKFDGTREEITEKAINYALFLTYKQLKNL